MVQVEHLLSKTQEYCTYIQKNPSFREMDRLFSAFLPEYFERVQDRPTKVDFTLFIFPGENYIEPMVVLHYPDVVVDRIQLRDQMLDSFKHYLANNAGSLNAFRNVRKVQRKYRFIVRGE
ncbi:MAG: hypothetical protein ACFFCS_20425 [Candidatus Hodarchaeota archaeon]